MLLLAVIAPPLAVLTFVPIFRHVFNSPDVAGFLESEAQNPQALKFPQ